MPMINRPGRRMNQIPPNPVRHPSNQAKALWMALSPEDRLLVGFLREKFKTNTADLSDWHRAGTLAVRVAPKGQSSYGKKAVYALRELIGCSPAYIYPCRTFARLYSDADVEKLEGKLSWSKVCRLMGIKDERIQKKLLTECIQKRWSIKQLERQIRSRCGRQRARGHGGRASRRPKNELELLVQLDQMLFKIGHWYDGMTRVPSSDPEAFDVDRLPGDLHKRLIATFKTLNEFHLFVQGMLAQLQSEKTS